MGLCSAAAFAQFSEFSLKSIASIINKVDSSGNQHVESINDRLVQFFYFVEKYTDLMLLVVAVCVVFVVF